MSAVDNPPAFPGGFSHDSGPCNGMTLRDWFAGHALAGFAANSTYLLNVATQADRLGIKHERALAMAAYKQADALLSERAKMGEG